MAREGRGILGIQLKGTQVGSANSKSASPATLQTINWDPNCSLALANSLALSPSKRGGAVSHWAHLRGSQSLPQLTGNSRVGKGSGREHLFNLLKIPLVEEMDSNQNVRKPEGRVDQSNVGVAKDPLGEIMKILYEVYMNPVELP
ncbi:hypothetical protein JHK82_031850 [Glycine max]|nr:hypothetical protein JHK82_031850 [Glycine max]